MTFHLHRWSSREGTRGRRSFATLYARDDTVTVATARCETYWASGSKHCGVELGIGDESMLGGSIRIPKVFSLYWGVGSPAIDRWLYQRGHRRPHDVHLVDVAVHDKAIWWSLLQPKHEWHSSTPRWRHGNFHPLDALLGRVVYTKDPNPEIRSVEIPTPEGPYPAVVQLRTDRWKRPRWPWPTAVVRRGDVDIPHGIPVPGKGENSWDCGDDAIYGHCGPARSVEDAIGQVVASVLSSRQRYGGRHTMAGV